MLARNLTLRALTENIVSRRCRFIMHDMLCYPTLEEHADATLLLSLVIASVTSIPSIGLRLMLLPRFRSFWSLFLCLALVLSCFVFPR